MLQNKKRMVAHLFVSVIAITLLANLISGCSKKAQKDPQEIREFFVGVQKYYIPRAYADFKYTSVGNESALIQAWYPGSTPVPGDPTELWKKGEWYKNVRILFTYYKKANPAGTMKTLVELNKAEKKIGIEYGLEHYTQYDENRGFNDDIYIEDPKTGSFITCSKKTDENDPVQMCTHYFYTGKVRFNVDYDKRLLPEWQAIKTNVMALYKSFESPVQAKEYIQQFYPATKGRE